MRSRQSWNVLAALWVSATAAAASAGPAVTVYTRDLGFVRETRTLAPGGRGDTLEIRDLPERLDFSSLRVKPAGKANVVWLAQRDEPSPADALERAIGRRARVVLRGERTVEGEILRVDHAWVVVREDGGAVQALARASVDAVALSAPGDWPPPMRSPASRVLAVLSDARGGAEAEVSYLTGGLSWSAEHTLVREGEGKGAWRTGVVVENGSGRTFRDATLQLVAGEPNRVSAPPMPKGMGRGMQMEMSVAQAAPADLTQESFSEYHLYRLERPATLYDGERQQLVMLAERDVTPTPRYRYHAGDARGVQLELEIANTRAGGPGAPLPGGRVRILERDARGALQFAGETNIGHTAEGETLRVHVGTVFDLAAERRQLSSRRITDREHETTVAITLRNRKATGVTIEVDEPVSGEVEVTKTSHKPLRPDANTLRFPIAVKPGASVTIEYTARVRY